jgi:peptide/nickel transport system permease protein
MYIQYFKWIGRIVTKGEFGYSFVYQRDAKVMILERLPMTFALSFFSLIFIWVVALPIGILSAVRQYSLADYTFTFIVIGLAVPNFLCLILLSITYKYFDRR